MRRASWEQAGLMMSAQVASALFENQYFAYDKHS